MSPQTEPMTVGASLPIVDVEAIEQPSRHLRDYLWVVYKYRWLSGTCCVLAIGIVAVVTLLTPRAYTATTRIQVARQSPIQLRLKENVLADDDDDHGGAGPSAFLATQVAALKSRDLAERAIRTHDLADNDAFLRPGSDRRGLDQVAGSLLAMLRPRGMETPVQPRPSSEEATGRIDRTLLDRYQDYLDVENVRGTDLIDIRFTTPSAALSALLAAAHTQAYMDANEEARRGTDVTAKEFLGRQLRESREKVETAEAALTRFSTEHPNVAINQDQKTVVQKITELSSLLTRVEAKRLDEQTRYEFVSRPDTDTLAYFFDRPGVQKMHAALVDLRTSKATLGLELGSRHPQMAGIASQEAELRHLLGTELAQEISAVRTRYEAELVHEDELRGKLTQQENLAADLRELGARYDMLKNEVESARVLHQSLLKQQLETSVNSELVATNVRVIERAEVSGVVTRPTVSTNLTLALLIGIALGVGAAFACEYFDSSVKSSAEIEGLLQIPTLATVPNFALAGRRTAAALGRPGRPAVGSGRVQDLVVLHEPRSPAAEAFRTLRTAMLFSAPGAPPKVVMMTSAGASEGKTVSAMNLATCLAESGARVLLIDCDLRRPGCHLLLGLTNVAGLSNFLAGQAELESVILDIEEPRLAFLPAGPPPPNPAELVGSGRMQAALAAARAAYDFVVIDTPPVLPVTDAVVLAREADGVLLVVKGHDTPRELVRRARDQLVQVNVRLLGVVVNNVDTGWGDLYFYSRYYGPPVATEASA